MAKNVGKKRGAQPRPAAGGGKSGNKSLIAFIGGLALGLGVAGGVYLLDLLPTAMELREHELACAEGADGKPAAKPAQAAADDEPKPVTFDFYNMLTKQQTVAPAPARSTTTATTPAPVPPAATMPAPMPAPTAPATISVGTPAAPVQAAPTAPATVASAPAAPAPAAAPAVQAARYTLQAGSFATRAEADRRRGELTLAGLDASVQKVSTDKGERYRVMAGAFSSEAAMKKAQQQLAGMKIDTLPVRLK